MADPIPAAVRLRHLVEPVEEKQAAILAQILEEVILSQAVILKLLLQELLQMARRHPFSRRRQAARREVAQHHAHRQQRTVVPRLGLRRLLEIVRFVPRQRSPKEREVDLGVAEDLPGMAERHEVDERALAAAGVSQQHEAALAVELLESRKLARSPQPQLTLVYLDLFRRQSPQRCIHRIQPKPSLPPPS